MTEVRYRLTWQLAVSIVLVIIIAMVPVIIYFLDYRELFIYIMSAIIGWTVLVLIALMGAFLLGLAVGHRLSSKSEFSPFEVEMMKMKEEVAHLKELLHRHNIHHKEDKEKAGPSPPKKEPLPVKEASMVEEEPDLEGPTDLGQGMKPLTKVKCRKCGGLIPIYSKERPLEVECTGCGKKGVLK